MLDSVLLLNGAATSLSSKTSFVNLVLTYVFYPSYSEPEDNAIIMLLQCSKSPLVWIQNLESVQFEPDQFEKLVFRKKVFPKKKALKMATFELFLIIMALQGYRDSSLFWIKYPGVCPVRAR